jgi:hypothetical protein
LGNVVKKVIESYISELKNYSFSWLQVLKLKNTLNLCIMVENVKKDNLTENIEKISEKHAK